MKRIYVIIVVLLCGLMMCCKKKTTISMKPGIYNVAILDSLGYKSVGMKIIPIDSVLPGKRGPMVAYYWNHPLHDAIIEFNKHFRHDVQDAINDEKKVHYTREEAARRDKGMKDGSMYWEDYTVIVRRAERDLDTIINHTRYVFSTELN